MAGKKNDKSKDSKLYLRKRKRLQYEGQGYFLVAVGYNCLLTGFTIPRLKFIPACRVFAVVRACQIIYHLKY